MVEKAEGTTGTVPTNGREKKRRRRENPGRGVSFLKT